MNIGKYTLILVSSMCLMACDPGLKGDLKVYNDTNQPLTVAYKEWDADTVYTDIQPNTYVVVKVLSGLGDKSDFECCPCQLKSIRLRSTAGQVKKDPENSDNWIIPNKSKLKRAGKEPVKCELHISQADL